jgi:hypothetical protein
MNGLLQLGRTIKTCCATYHRSFSHHMPILLQLEYSLPRQSDMPGLQKDLRMDLGRVVGRVGLTERTNSLEMNPLTKA